MGTANYQASGRDEFNVPNLIVRNLPFILLDDCEKLPIGSMKSPRDTNNAISRFPAPKHHFSLESKKVVAISKFHVTDANYKSSGRNDKFVSGRVRIMRMHL